jgi:hypothetical protein
MTIAQQLKVTNFPFVIKNDLGKEIYYEDSDGWWKKREWDDKGNVIYFEDSDGYWEKKEWDDKGKDIYFEDSDGYWEKREWDDKGKEEIYYEDSDGTIKDDRPKPIPEYTMEELTAKLGHNFKIKK